MKYRAARAEKFSLDSEEHRTNRVVNALVKTLTQSHDNLAGKTETFLTCRAVAEKFGVKIGEHSAEEYALAWIYRTLLKANPLTCSEIQMFLKALPKLLKLPYPIVKDLRGATLQIIPQMMNVMNLNNLWKEYVELDYL